MPSASSRKQVSSTASGRKVYVKFQNLTGTPNGQGGFVNGGNWNDIAGVTQVPITFRTWSPYEKYIAQQLYPGVTSRWYMRLRRGANIIVTIRMGYAPPVYWIRCWDTF